MGGVVGGGLDSSPLPIGGNRRSARQRVCRTGFGKSEQLDREEFGLKQMVSFENATKLNMKPLYSTGLFFQNDVICERQHLLVGFSVAY